MELTKFTFDDILKLDPSSKEVEDWMELCAVQGKFRVINNKPIHISPLQCFIENFPPEKDLEPYQAINYVNVVTFGLYYFNKERILNLNLTNEDLKKFFEKEESFYKKLISPYCSKVSKYLISSNLDMFEMRLNVAKEDIHFKIKKRHEMSLLKEKLGIELNYTTLVDKKNKI